MNGDENNNNPDKPLLPATAKLVDLETCEIDELTVVAAIYPDAVFRLYHVPAVIIWSEEHNPAYHILKCENIQPITSESLQSVFLEFGSLEC